MQYERDASMLEYAIRSTGGRSDPALEQAQNLLSAQHAMSSYGQYSSSYTQPSYSQPQQPVYTAQRQTVASITDILQPKITDEASLRNKANLEQFYRESNRNFDEEEFVKDELNKNLNLLSNVTGGVNYTETMLSKDHYNGFIPFYITNTASSTQYVDISFENGKNKIAMKKIPEKAFKSTTDYEQPVSPGLDTPRSLLPTVTEPKGNTKNCLLINVRLYDITNSTNYPIALILGQREGQIFKPWGKRTYHVDQGAFPAGSGYDLVDSRVHWVIPPKYTRTNESLTIYKSGYEVNLPLGALYPSVDGKLDTLIRSANKVESNGQVKKFTAVAEHPVVEWLFANKEFYPKLQLPTFSSESTTEKAVYDIEAQTFQWACELFLKEFNLAVPVVDLSQMEIHALVLNSGVNSFTSELNGVKELDRMIRNLQFGKDVAISSKMKETNDTGSLWFRMCTDHIFRDETVPPSVEKIEN